MTELKIELPDEIAESLEEKATAMGTTADQLVSIVLTDVVAEMPETDNDWQYR
ncbi:hypothetical protein [Roseomonas marmotae]|uniref:Uncharacterized protein n=1 Tax=Roseomonas marmotae TaxID=2768161 RepID=A0ABS3K824_9PROT|nr:hypothetical protein [Roseomonas marmotae]MBO1073157.1 hypothetical protein [Roseomonas marmotae]QTI79207.1 hypothetical protein IAI58_16560 [Roseomonas marmotae]